VANDGGRRMRIRFGVACSCVALICAGNPALAHDLCPDRPGKGTAPCTVDPGHIQLEADLFNGTYQRSHGVTSELDLVANPTIKYGVSETFDIEANFAPYMRTRVRDRASGVAETHTGHGDLFLRAKSALIGAEGGAFALTLSPFVKIPTASSNIGNGAVEGGLLVPLALDLGGGWSLSATPEADALKNASDEGYHAALVNVVGVSRALGGGVSLGAELWGSADFDPSGTTQQYSADLAVAWQPPSRPNLQIDGGLNVGLNSNTPDIQVYTGLSERF